MRPVAPAARLARAARLLVLAVLAVGAAVGCGTAVPASPTEFVEPPAPPAPAGMPQVRIDDLPAEAMLVLDLIEQGGPFPYRQDGATFENREGLLPQRPRGHYREYTVETPGEDDRGARRIVAGADGERFWTEDHYASFAWIAE